MPDMHQLDGSVALALAAKLRDLQGDRTDADMGAILGVTRSQWHHIRTGKRVPSYASIRRAVRVFPELSMVIMRDLSEAAS